MNVLLDSTVWIEFLTNGKNAKRFEKYFKSPYKIILPAIVTYEVYKKIKSDLGEGKAILVLAQIEEFANSIVPIKQEVAIKAADTSLLYKIPMADSMIYATSCLNSALLVTMDAYFKGLSGVEYIAQADRPV